MRQNDGGPAFPCEESHGDAYEGMTLRDYFAAKAMAAIRRNCRSGTTSDRQIALWSYETADAMIAVRNEGD